MDVSAGFLANMRLLTKICLIVAVPTLGLLFTSITQMIQKRDIAAQMRLTAQIVDRASDVSVLAHSLQREAAASAAFVSGGREGDANLADLQRESATAGKTAA